MNSIQAQLSTWLTHAPPTPELTAVSGGTWPPRRSEPAETLRPGTILNGIYRHYQVDYGIAKERGVRYDTSFRTTTSCWNSD